MMGFSNCRNFSFYFPESYTEVGCKNVTLEASSSIAHLTFSVRFPKVNVCQLGSMNSMMKGYFFQNFQNMLNIPKGKIISQQVHFTLCIHAPGMSEDRCPSWHSLLLSYNSLKAESPHVTTGQWILTGSDRPHCPLHSSASSHPVSNFYTNRIPSPCGFY